MRENGDFMSLAEKILLCFEWEKIKKSANLKLTSLSFGYVAWKFCSLQLEQEMKWIFTGVLIISCNLFYCKPWCEITNKYASYVISPNFNQFFCKHYLKKTFPSNLQIYFPSSILICCFSKLFPNSQIYFNFKSFSWLS